MSMDRLFNKVSCLDTIISMQQAQSLGDDSPLIVGLVYSPINFPSVTLYKNAVLPTGPFPTTKTWRFISSRRVIGCDSFTASCSESILIQQLNGMQRALSSYSPAYSRTIDNIVHWYCIIYARTMHHSETKQ